MNRRVRRIAAAVSSATVEEWRHGVRAVFHGVDCRTALACEIDAEITGGAFAGGCSFGGATGADGAPYVEACVTERFAGRARALAAAVNGEGP